MAQAVCRVFARLGEKENRSRARFKFLVKKLGRGGNREAGPGRARRAAPGSALDRAPGGLVRGGRAAAQAAGTAGSHRPWPTRPLTAGAQSNVRAQAQAGYAVATITLPLGDLTSAQARSVAALAGVSPGTPCARRWTRTCSCVGYRRRTCPSCTAELEAIGLGEPAPGTISDVTSCPGTDTCKLGISASRGLSGELRRRLTVLDGTIPEAARALHIKCSGCFNACGQHHVADIGFLGVSRTISGRRVPHFQLVVGGQWTENAAAFGLAIGAIPSKRVPEAVERLSRDFAENKREGETYRAYVQRIGKKAVREQVEDLTQVPPYEVDPVLLRRLGRSARVHHRRHGHR